MTRSALTFGALPLGAMVLGLALCTPSAVEAQQACQQQKVLSSDGNAGSEFGEAFAVSGNTTVVCSWRHDVLGTNSGAAYVFERRNARWVETARLLASDGAPEDLFGAAAGAASTHVVVASIFDDDNGTDSGSAYVYEKVGGEWVQTKKLLPNDGAANDRFGVYADASDNVCVVTAHFDDDNGADSGSAYIFEKVGGEWLQTAKLLASDGAAGDEFGFSCAIWETTAVITAVHDDDNGVDSGSAYVFEKQGSSWVQVQKLTASDGTPVDRFGIHTSIEKNTIVVGSMHDDPSGNNSGSAYVFEKQEGSWVQTAKLTADDGAAGDFFGLGTGVSGTTIAIGAYRKDRIGTDSGAAYVFRKQSGSWTQTQKLLGDDTAGGDWFGFQLDLDRDTLVIGAPRNDDNGFNSGSAYFFSASGNPPSYPETWVLDAINLGKHESVSSGEPRRYLGQAVTAFVIPLEVDSCLQVALAGTPPIELGPDLLAARGAASLLRIPGTNALAGQLDRSFVVLDGGGTLVDGRRPAAVLLVPRH